LCWKHEWAKAIGNIQKAIKYIERAKESLEKRLERNLRNLERCKKDPKWNYPSILEPIQKLIQKNTRAIEECNTIIKVLRCRQNQLYKMIQQYGISRKASSKRLKQLMGDYRPPEALTVGE